MAKTIVGIFEDATSAQRVLKELPSLGIQSDHARVLNNQDALASDTTSSTSSSSATPDVPWTEKIKHWFGSLFEEDDDRAHAEHYAEAWRRGHFLVVVDAESEMVEPIVNLMNRNGAVDIQRRSEEWKQTGYTGTYDANAAPYSSEQFEQERATYSDRATMPGAGNQAIPVVEEELAVGKRVVQRGGVRVHSYVEERPVEEIVRLREERVNVQRVPVDRPADASDLAFKDRTLEVTAAAEEPVVEKHARVVEEVLVNKEVTEREQKVEDTVRRKDVQVENIPADTRPHHH